MIFPVEIEEGCRGLIPTEDLEYSYKHGRITIVRNGETILDKEFIIDPKNKYQFNIDKNPEDSSVYKVDIEPASEVKEYNVANMLPQGEGVNAKPLQKVEEYGPDLMTAETKEEDNALDESANDIDSTDAVVMESNNSDDKKDKDKKEKKKVKIPKETFNLIKGIAVLKAKLKFLTKVKNKSEDNDKAKLKIVDTKKEIIEKEKQKRKIISDEPTEVKSELEKIANEIYDATLKTVDEALTTNYSNEELEQHFQACLNTVMDEARRVSEQATQEAIRASNMSASLAMSGGMNPFMFGC